MSPTRSLKQSQAWLERSRRVIPGAAQTFSKGATQRVVGAEPLFLERGEGAHVWDVDGNRYLDLVQGLLPNILGYAHPAVERAAISQLRSGHSFSLPHPSEVELAERLVELIPCAEMVRFAKNGSDATSGAVRAARAYTGRELIACCGYHGWHDWYIGTTSRSAGVPNAVRALTRSFEYGDLHGLQRILEDAPGGAAAVILEPMSFHFPQPGFLERVRELCQRYSAVLIFDEICSGWHFGLGGAQKYFGVEPDLACFGKAMANGFPLSAVVGRAEIMQIFDEVFFSLTFAGETVSLAAALATLDVLEHEAVVEGLFQRGRRLQDGINELALAAGADDWLSCIGIPSWTLVTLDAGPGEAGYAMRSLFQQEMARREVLILTTHNLTHAHDDAAIDALLGAYEEVIPYLADARRTGRVAALLEGPPLEPVFRVRG